MTVSDRVHVHDLFGCAPAPLASYLKALGILRLVAEQADPDVRGFWRDEHFSLVTTLDREALERFFLNVYAPTPLVSPWNMGSGFFSKQDALTALEASRAPRFAAFRTAIADARLPLEAIAAAAAVVRELNDRTKERKGMTAAAKAAAKALKADPGFEAELRAALRRVKLLKADLFGPCALTWRGPHRAWMDAAVVLASDGKASFPSLLGTGGNDGNMDFTNNTMQRIADLFDVRAADGKPHADAADLLRGTLWRGATNRLTTAAVGQFSPGDAGGANASTGPSGESLINPWDFVLMLEGAILFTARSTRRLDPITASRASAPFAVRAHAAGHGSAGDEKAERGEQWMPLWSRPTHVADLQAMLGEARLQLGRSTAYRPVDVARAIARLGVARGVTRFVRFGFLERNGKSVFAVPLGYVDVAHRPGTRIVDDLAPWLDRLARLARGKNAPARLAHAEHRLADAVLAALTHDDSPARWQAVLLAATAVEAIEAGGTAIQAGPIPPLSSAWVAATADGSSEWRLACALGSAAAGYDNDHSPTDPVRHHWLPLERGARRFREHDKRLTHDPRVVTNGRDALTDLAAIVQRRLIEAAAHGQRRLPMVAAPGFAARPADLAALLQGDVDVARVWALARALMAARWDRARRGSPSATPVLTHQPTDAWPDEAWVVLRLACLPWPIDDERSIPADDAPIRRLIAHDGATAVELALRRLRAAGLRPPIRGAVADPATARLWAAALAFPISRRLARAMAQSFAPTASP